MDDITLKPNLSAINNGNGRRNVSDSPEFEFWMVRNPTLPQPNLVPADELFLNGVLLPLHHHSEPHDMSTGSKPPELSLSTGSKRWKDIWFKKATHEDNSKLDKITKEKIDNNNNNINKSTQNRATCSRELNIISIWPFSRSRSAGNNGSRPRLFAGARKASSAPCSRSNSAGDPKSRKLEKSPSRSGGVHLRRPPMVVRKIPAAAGGKAEVLNVNVPICMGHRRRLSRCKSDEMNVAGGGGTDGVGRLSHFRSFFTKKVY